MIMMRKTYRARAILVALLVIPGTPSLINSQSTWQPLGAQYSVNVVSDISLGYSGGTRTLYLAAKEDNVIVSVGGTFTWTKGLVPAPDFVTCQKDRPLVAYAGVNVRGQTMGAVLKRTSDGGQSWSLITSGIENDNAQLTCLSISSIGVLFVGADEFSSGAQQAVHVLFLSFDDGVTWNTPVFPTSGISVKRIVSDPFDPLFQYLGGVAGINQGVWKSSDQGNSWTQTLEAPIISLAIDRRNTNVLYAGTDESNTRIYRSTDQGSNWSSVFVLGGYRINDLAVDPATSTVYAASSRGLLKSTDGGSWTKLTSGLAEIDIRSVEVDPTTANLVYIGTPSKFYYSTDGGTTWTDASPDLVPAGGITVYNNDIYLNPA